MMDNLLYQFLSSRQITFANMIVGVVLFALLLIMFFSKNCRDERGKKIIGKASIVSLIVFAVCATFISHYMQSIAVQQFPGSGELQIDAYLAVNAIQLLYNITATVEIIGILFLKQRE